MSSSNQHFRKPDPVVLAFCALILISCLGAAGRQGRMRAKAMVCLANLQQWGAMFQTYTDDHDGNFNPGWDVGVTELWMNALRPYYGDRWSLLLCPTATKLDESSVGEGTFAPWYRRLTVPDGGAHTYVSSYGINSWTNHMTGSRGDRLEEWFWGTTQGIQTPSNVPVLADATWHDSWPRPTDIPLSTSLDSGGGSTGPFSEMSLFSIDRHSGAVNVLFMDWSVRPVGLKELWTLKWHRQFDTEGPWTTAGGVQPTDWPAWMRGFKNY